MKFESLYLKTYLDGVPKKWQISKGGFKSEDTGEYLHCHQKYSKSLSWAENLNLPPKTVNNIFKFYAQVSDLEYLCWRRKNSPVSSDILFYIYIIFFTKLSIIFRIAKLCLATQNVSLVLISFGFGQKLWSISIFIISLA